MGRHLFLCFASAANAVLDLPNNQGDSVAQATMLNGADFRTFPMIPGHVWTFAYGANIGSPKLRAAGIAPVLTLPASLPGWRLVFNGDLGVNATEPAFADVVKVEPRPDRGGVGTLQAVGVADKVLSHAESSGESLTPVQGVLHSISQAELQVLDKSEAPFYHRVLIPAETKWSGQWHTVPAWTYEGNRLPVQLVVQPFEVHGVTGFHTFVRVGNEELAFDYDGITIKPSGALSVSMPPGFRLGERHTIDLGTTWHSGAALKRSLDPFFVPKSYDLLRKNCNSFTDVALAYLLHKRLDSKYTQLERAVAQSPSLVQVALGSRYEPNPQALDFDQDRVAFEVEHLEERSPSARYARLVYCGTIERHLLASYATPLVRHLRSLGLASVDAFKCKRTTLENDAIVGRGLLAGTRSVDLPLTTSNVSFGLQSATAVTNSSSVVTVGNLRSAANVQRRAKSDQRDVVTIGGLDRRRVFSDFLWANGT